MKLKTICLLLALAPTIGHSEVKVINYTGFTIWLDCAKHGPYKFEYEPKKDTGNLPRAADFTFDPKIPKQCQQISTAAYGNGYDRGHMVPENHLDYSKLAMQQANYMTNILPQTSTFNRSGWLATEEIVECYRDIANLYVTGGTIWGNNPNDDYFVKTHNVITPDAYWKIIINKDTKQSISWIIPNSNTASRNNLDSYLVSINDIEKATGEKLNTPNINKATKLSSSWKLPQKCQKN